MKLTTASVGSSPPARGTPLCIYRVSSLIGAPVHPRPRGEHYRPTVLERRASTVHPRPRGEHERRQIEKPAAPGSSPPARGTRPVIGELASTDGGSSPPARGTRASADRETRRLPVHPRPRGEHARYSACHEVSSVHPRPRGEHRHSDLTDDRQGRFIPARAGNTQPELPFWERAQFGSSPPARGTPRPSATRLNSRSFGSSPPARGTRRDPPAPSAHPAFRFIPARAGNTRPLPTLPSCEYRFIPARAGNTTKQVDGIPRDRIPVHPRPRGEHPLRVRRGGACRVRFIPARAGNTGRRRRAPCDNSRRFIPARAGNTRTRCASVSQASHSVHPRPRGEHYQSGEPPVPSSRFIPARAGNTWFRWPEYRRVTGSSPPARGTLGVRVRPVFGSAVHPRPRGEHFRRDPDVCAW